jgi:hypothetical protein
MIRTLALSTLIVLLPLTAGAQTAPQSAVALALDPRGDGAPAAVTCRIPQPLPGSRLRGPLVCQTNRVWAALAAHNSVILPDGKTLVATGLTSEACGAERVTGVTPLIRLGNTRTFYRCNF